MSWRDEAEGVNWDAFEALLDAVKFDPPTPEGQKAFDALVNRKASVWAYRLADEAIGLQRRRKWNEIVEACR